MAYVTRKAVGDALLALLSTMTLPAPDTLMPNGYTFRTTGRRILQWDQVTDQPALFVHKWPESAKQNQAFPLTKWRWHYAAIIYYRTDGTMDQAFAPDQIVEAYLDAIDAVMQPFPGPPVNVRQTLGNLVWHAFIEGDVVFDSGMDDQQGVIVVPISVIVTSP